MIGYGDEPSVLVIADSDAAADRARNAIALGGGRVRDVVPLAHAIACIEQHAAPNVAWAELDEDAGDPLDRLLDRLDSEAATARFAVIVSSPLALVDAVAAATPRLAIAHLCEPSVRERIEAFEALRLAADPTLHDISRDATPRLQRISEEVGRIASLLAELSEEEGGEGDGAPGQPRLVAPATIRSIIRARRLRDRFFPGELFADPAWDMMLDLMAARLEQRRVAVSSLCIAAAVPPTTALRWIKHLTEAGLFHRVADPQDGRRVYVELTDPAAAAFESYLNAVPRVAGLVV